MNRIACHPCSRIRRAGILPALVCGLAALLPQGAQARVRLENICTIHGQQEQKLIGLGLVLGLKGTGDGGKSVPAIRALAAALKNLYNPVDGPGDLKDVTNVALVIVEATVPAEGIRRGQKIDCFINSVGGAKSLRGGRLMMTPLGGQNLSEEKVMGVASGALIIEDATTPTSARVPSGVVISSDIVNLFVDNGSFKLLLDKEHSSFQAASVIAQAVNADSTFEALGARIAKAIGPGVVQVLIPEQYLADPVQFVAQVLEVGVDNPHTQARVVINQKTQTVIVTGEVEISPVVVNHRSLSVSVGGDSDAPADPVPGVGFVSVLDQQARQSPQRLEQLTKALNQLKVPTSDVIDIIKELHRTGKLHAVLIVE